MSKKAIDFSQMNEKAIAHLQNFAVTRIAIAKEDQRHKAEKKSLKAQLDAIHENRELNIKAGFPRMKYLSSFPLWRLIMQFAKKKINIKRL